MRGITVYVMLAMLALAVALSLPTQRGGAAAAEQFDIQKAVTGATTPADHETIAAYYDREAAAAKDKATEHHTLAERYRTLSVTPRGQGFQSMVNHCQQLAQHYESVATDNAALAAAHRQMAQEATQQKR